MQKHEIYFSGGGSVVVGHEGIPFDIFIVDKKLIRFDVAYFTDDNGLGFDQYEDKIPGGIIVNFANVAYVRGVR